MFALVPTWHPYSRPEGSVSVIVAAAAARPWSLAYRRRMRLAVLGPLVAAGWTVLRFTWDDVVRRPEQVASSILRLLGALDAG